MKDLKPKKTDLADSCGTDFKGNYIFTSIKLYGPGCGKKNSNLSADFIIL